MSYPKYNISPKATMEHREYTREDDYYFEGSGDLFNCKSLFNTPSPKWIQLYFTGKFDKIEDNCFNHPSVRCAFFMGGELTSMGDNCFRSPILGSLSLPETLESIGHNNFNGTITTFNIPSKIKDFPADNLIDCSCLGKITVSEGNIAYKAYDDILYNSDFTEVVFCPNAKVGEINLPNTIKRINDYGFYCCRYINKISMPPFLEAVGNNCFSLSKFESIDLPETLESIGHHNFGKYLTTFNIPSKIKNFPIDNLIACSSLRSITVSEGNIAYKVLDDILYNADFTVVLFCPNAKKGVVVLPDTVNHIGDYCFYGCKYLNRIVIPQSVESIGSYAFSESSLKKLTIPTSVKSIGDGCFKGSMISECLKLPEQILVFPDEAFQNSSIKEFSFSFRSVTKIGDNAIADIEEDIIPRNVSFKSLSYLGDKALNYCNKTDVFEFFSCLEHIGSDAFINTKDTVLLRYYSYCPIRLNQSAFHEIPENATLIVPKGTKTIFKNAMPWSILANIKECDLDVDFDDNGKEVIVSDEKYFSRLKSVAHSKVVADRYYLQEILENLCLSYLYVDSEEEFTQAIEILKYNRCFSPAIIPNLEQKMCQNWANKYKMKFASTVLLENPAGLLSFSDEETRINLPVGDTFSLPLETPPTLSGSSAFNVQVFFNNNILQQIESVLALTDKSLKIAVSWFTNYRLFSHVKEIAASGIKVQLITNNDLTNNGGYCLNFNELIAVGVEISLIEYPHLLHHKFCIIDDNIVVNGSYNWTRFSDKNYENITVFRNNSSIVHAFTEEFDSLLQNAEYKCISQMPEFVPERPEYDRSAFRQYVTEELDAEARETTDEREKITALQKAVSLNSEYIDKINPEAKKKYAEAFKTVEDSVAIKKNIVAMIEGNPLKTTLISTEVKAANQKITSSSSISAPSTTSVAVVTREEQSIIDEVKASSLLMVLDISSSMSGIYSAGHVHNISTKALSASLAITDSKEVSLWTFGDGANFIDNVGIDTIDKINQVWSKNEATYLKRFVDAANSSIKDNALVIIFTDDDAQSIAAAIPTMQKRDKVFWQIIVYGNSHENITKSISDVSNTSVVSLTDYASKTDEQLSQTLLHDYIYWKNNE